MEELIKVENKNGELLVSARELHNNVKEGNERFSKWFERMCTYGFEENVDYTLYQMVHPQNKQEIVDYALKIECAKEIAMIQRSEKGKQVRKYFIECERQLKEQDNFSKLLVDIYNGGEKGIAASKQLREIEAKKIREKEVKPLEIQLNKNKEWWTIKKVGALLNISYKDLDWRKLKAASNNLGFNIQKVFDANYGQVNAYHVKVWKYVYPEYDLEEFVK